MTRVLIVDDEPALTFALAEVLEARGYDVRTADSGSAALAALGDGSGEFDVVVSDYAMPELDGLQLLERVIAFDASLPVILLTAHGSEQLAVRALKQGAHDYVTKPFDNDEVVYSIERAAETRRLRVLARSSAIAASATGSGAGHATRIVGTSPALGRVLDAAVRVAQREVTVLVRGETGTGKELVAGLLHAHSARAGKPLVVFNSAAIPHDLAEGELFGYARGAFTGATAPHIGFFAQAHGGTLFLDEVGELPLDVQAKLLRALQAGEIQPLGSAKLEQVDVRVIAATHRDLVAEVKAGRFREDLYYRLNVVELVVPPLRERAGDIPELAREFARKYSERFGLGYVVQLAPELLAQLEREAWPGNVRQLENTVARAVALASGRIVGLEVLGADPNEAAHHDGNGANGNGANGNGHANGNGANGNGHANGNGANGNGRGPSFREQVEAFERTLLRNALAAAGGNQSETARRLQLNRASLYDKLKKYGM